MTDKLPDRICIWDKSTHCDGEVMPRGWTISFRPEHDGQYVRADLFEALTAERDALRKEWLEADRALQQRALQAAKAEAERDALRAALSPFAIAWEAALQSVGTTSTLGILEALAAHHLIGGAIRNAAKEYNAASSNNLTNHNETAA